MKLNRKVWCAWVAGLCGIGLTACAPEKVARTPEKTLEALPALTDVAVPAMPGAPDVYARAQPPIPDSFTGKELPYREERAAPAPTPEESARGFILYSRPITRAVYSGTTPEASERVERLTAFATRGEYEPMTFSVYALRDLKNLRVQVSDLRMGEARIGADRLDLRLVTEWAMRFPMYTSPTWRRVPELLESVTANSFAAGLSQRYWLTVHTPENAPAGLYRGTVTLFDEASRRAVQIPILYRVLGYQLQRDLTKRYSVYYYDIHYEFPGMTNDLLDRAMQNEFAAMQAHGIEMFPTIPIMETRGENGAPEVGIRNPQVIDKMIEAGFKGPILLIGGIGHFYRKFVPDGKQSGHWVVDRYPETDEIYDAVEKAFLKLRLFGEARGWPEFVVCPMDEVSPASAEFAAKIFAAIRRAGLKTYITKDPTAPDAEVYRKLDAVDFWCSQPYAMPYEKVVADKQCGYWVYPNHNAGEMKDRETMQRGGRMTYGFGYWRSGYTAILPWHWRWTPDSSDPFNYLGHERTSGCGTRMDEAGNVIPPVYWECFREGVDDLRYLYTLQQTVADRLHHQDPRCRALAEDGRKLIQQIWDSIAPQTKYLESNSWPDDQFTAIRWRIARMTEDLLAFPAQRGPAVPSVTANPESVPVPARDPFEEAEKNGWLESRDLGEDGFSKWHAINSEVTLTALPEGGEKGVDAMRMKVLVDHKVDGGGEDGKYPIGWPRIRRAFKSGELSLGAYDYFVFRVRQESNRDEVADDRTPFVLNFSGHGGGKRDLSMDFGDTPRVWMPIRIPLAEMLDSAPGGAASLLDLSGIQLVIAESAYTHGAALQFDFEEMAFVRLTRPVLDRIRCSDAFLLPAADLPLAVTFFGSAAADSLGCRIHVSLVNAAGARLVTQEFSTAEAASCRLKTEGIKAGPLDLIIEIVDRDGKVLSSGRKSILALPGYWTGD